MPKLRCASPSLLSENHHAKPSYLLFGQNLKNLLVIENSSIPGSPVSRFAPAKKPAHSGRRRCLYLPGVDLERSRTSSADNSTTLPSRPM